MVRYSQLFLRLWQAVLVFLRCMELVKASKHTVTGQTTIATQEFVLDIPSVRVSMTLCVSPREPYMEVGEYMEPITLGEEDNTNPIPVTTPMIMECMGDEK